MPGFAFLALDGVGSLMLSTAHLVERKYPASLQIALSLML